MRFNACFDMCMQWKPLNKTHLKCTILARFTVPSMYFLLWKALGYLRNKLGICLSMGISCHTGHYYSSQSSQLGKAGDDFTLQHPSQHLLVLWKLTKRFRKFPDQRQPQSPCSVTKICTICSSNLTTKFGWATKKNGNSLYWFRCLWDATSQQLRRRYPRSDSGYLIWQPMASGRNSIPLLG